MKPRTALAAALAITLTPAVPASAQVQDTTPVVDVGTRVRVSAPSLVHRPVDGRIHALAADTLVLQRRRDERIAFPLDSVTAVEVSLGVRSDAGRGAVYGTLAGLLIGAYWCLQDNCGFFAPLVLPLMAGGGLIVGGLIGWPSEEWQEVPISRVRASLRREEGGGATLEVSVRF